MGTAVSMKNKALLYYAAKDFVHLDFQQKFHVGFRLGITDHFDAMRDEDNLEEYIFRRVVEDDCLEEFVASVRAMKYEEHESC